MARLFHLDALADSPDTLGVTPYLPYPLTHTLYHADCSVDDVEFHYVFQYDYDPGENTIYVFNIGQRSWTNEA